MLGGGGGGEDLQVVQVKFAESLKISDIKIFLASKLSFKSRYIFGTHRVCVFVLQCSKIKRHFSDNCVSRGQDKSFHVELVSDLTFFMLFFSRLNDLHQYDSHGYA